MKTEFVFTENNALTTFYTMGNPEIEREILMLLIGNLDKLQFSIIQSFEQHDYVLFSETLQRGRGTINIINNMQLNSVLEALQFHQLNAQDPVRVAEKLETFRSICKAITDSLTSEIESIQAA